MHQLNPINSGQSIFLKNKFEINLFTNSLCIWITGAVLPLYAAAGNIIMGMYKLMRHNTPAINTEAYKVILMLSLQERYWLNYLGSVEVSALQWPYFALTIKDTSQVMNTLFYMLVIVNNSFIKMDEVYF